METISSFGSQISSEHFLIFHEVFPYMHLSAMLLSIANLENHQQLLNPKHRPKPGEKLKRYRQHRTWYKNHSLSMGMIFDIISNFHWCFPKSGVFQIYHYSIPKNLWNLKSLKKVTIPFSYSFIFFFGLLDGSLMCFFSCTRVPWRYSLQLDPV